MRELLQQARDVLLGLYSGGAKRFNGPETQMISQTLAALDAALVQQVADGRAMQPAPPIVDEE